MLRPDSDFGVIVRHPDVDRHAWAVETESGMVPSWTQPEGPVTQTWEKTALELARLVTGNPTHSVDRRFVTDQQKPIYLMKLTRDERLQAGYDWYDCDPEVGVPADILRTGPEAAGPQSALGHQIVQSY